MTPVVLTLSACAVGPNYVSPQASLPVEWQGHASSEPAELAHWWSTLDDWQLGVLIDRGIAGNRDLRRAVGRVEESRALRRAVASARFPEVNADGSAGYGRPSENAGAFGADSTTLYRTGLSASWEVDVFGRVRRSVEAATADLQEAEEDRRAVLVAVCAEIASAYIDVRTVQRRLQVNQANLESQGKIVELTKIRFDNGIASGLDVAQAETVYAETRVSIPALQRSIEQGYNRLSVLLGENPGMVRQELSIAWDLPTPPPALRAGVPADLLRQRPDIRRAERAVAAQTARIGIATADLYPRFTLLGSLGVSATDAADLPKGASVFYSLGPSVFWNVFDTGRLRALITVEESRTEQAIAQYELTLLQALEDVENALIAFARLNEEKVALNDALAAATQSLNLATDLYTDGIADFQNVLDAQRTYLQFQDRLANTEGLIVQSVVQLYRALGGGWQSPPSSPTNEEHLAGEELSLATF